MNKKLFQAVRLSFVWVLAFVSMHTALAQQAVSNLDEVGGRVLTLYTHPLQPHKLWAGTSHGGLWHSVDEGRSWRLASDLITNRAVAALAADPLNPDIMFAGTGNGRTRDAAARGNGMYKSVDGGASWSLLSLTSPATAGENWSHINSIAVSTTGVLLAATSDHKANGFVYRSSDGGQSWGLVPVYAGSKVGPRNMIHQIKFDPANPNRAIFMDDYANLTHTLDGGVTWSIARKSPPCP